MIRRIAGQAKTISPLELAGLGVLTTGAAASLVTQLLHLLA